MTTTTHRDNVMPVILDLLKDYGNDLTVLEIGQGRDETFKKMFEDKGWKYMATDNMVGINNLLGKLEGEKYHHNSMDDLKDFEEESIDLVFSCHAFEHCENPVKALREAFRVLKQGGHLLMVTPWCCKHHVIDADPDHIFVLNSYQLMRLTHYIGFVGNVIEQRDITFKEQDFNIVTYVEKLG